MKKKLIGVLMGTAVAAVALTGCGNKKSETEAPATEKTTEAAVATEATEKTTTAEEGVLVVGLTQSIRPTDIWMIMEITRDLTLNWLRQSARWRDGNW